MAFTIYNAISLGIPTYWKTIEKDTRLNYPNIDKGIPLFIGKANYTFYDESYWPIVEDSTSPQAKNQGNIPLDVFRYNTQDEVNDIIGASASNTSWAFTLTDKITVSRWGKKSKTEDGKNYRISSVMIPQSFNDEDSIYLINEESVSLSTMESENLLTDIVGSGRYIIDAVGFYNLGKTACRIYIFSDDIDLFDPYSIMSYFVSLQTTSLYNNSVRDWLTLYSLSYLDQYIDDDIVHEWPVKLPDPPPSINFDDIPINNFDKYNVELNVYAVGSFVSDAKYDEIVKQNILIYDFGQKGLLTWEQVKRVYNDFNINFDIKADYYLYKIPSNNDFSKNINLQIKDITDGTNNDILGINYEFHYPFRQSVPGVFTKLELYFYYNGVKLLMSYRYWIGAKGMYGDNNRATQKCIIKLPKTFTIKALKN